MDGTVLLADSYEKTSADESWVRGSPIPQITNEKELYVSVIIKSLLIHNDVIHKIIPIPISSNR